MLNIATPAARFAIRHLPWPVYSPRPFQRNYSKKGPQALLRPDQLLPTICGKARVPAAVRERILIAFFTQEQELLELQHAVIMQQPANDVKQQTFFTQQDNRDQELVQELRAHAHWEVAHKTRSNVAHLT